MQTVRALIADSDVLVRQKLAALLEAAADIKCDVVSPDGGALFARLSEDSPDILLLDLEGAEPGGLETFARVRSLSPTMPVVVLASRTESGAELALDALLDGAVDFIAKPEKGVNVLFADGHLKKRLDPVFRIAVGRQSQNVHPSGRDFRSSGGSAQKVEAFAIGGCSGAVTVLNEILAGLDSQGAYLLIAQHMPRAFTTALARRLSMLSSRPVIEAVDGSRLTSDRIWLAPGGRHLALRESGHDLLLNVHGGRRESGCRPAIDALFRSMADTFKSNAAGIVLSGSPPDALAGCRAIRDAGGQIFVQEPGTALVPELPDAVIAAGLATAVLSPEEIVDVINSGSRLSEGSSVDSSSRSSFGYSSGSSSGSSSGDGPVGNTPASG